MLLLLEDLLSGFTAHWQIILGPFLVLVVLFAKRGLFGILPDGGPRPGSPDSSAKGVTRSSRPGDAGALLENG